MEIFWDDYDGFWYASSPHYGELLQGKILRYSDGFEWSITGCNLDQGNYSESLIHAKHVVEKEMRDRLKEVMDYVDNRLNYFEQMKQQLEELPQSG